jgi:hypothetical protein
VSPFPHTTPSGRGGDEGLANISSSDNDVSDSDRSKIKMNDNKSVIVPPQQYIAATAITSTNFTNFEPTSNNNKKFSYVDIFYNTNNSSTNNNNNKNTSSPKKRQTNTDVDKENKRQKKESVYDEVILYFIYSLPITYFPLKGTSCTICFESWKTSGLHRICCLKCGHLFGKRYSHFF